VTSVLFYFEDQGRLEVFAIKFFKSDTHKFFVALDGLALLRIYDMRDVLHSLYHGFVILSCSIISSISCCRLRFLKCSKAFLCFSGNSIFPLYFSSSALSIVIFDVSLSKIRLLWLFLTLDNVLAMLRIDDRTGIRHTLR
jgi:hypothetical protein